VLKIKAGPFGRFAGDGSPAVGGLRFWRGMPGK